MLSSLCMFVCLSVVIRYNICGLYVNGMYLERMLFSLHTCICVCLLGMCPGNPV